MPFHPTSFLLGLATALVVPLATRVFRPLAVEAAVAGMGMVDEGSRLIAEQMETLEDIVAEARARRDEALADGNGHVAAEAPDEESDRVASRRRGNGNRRRSS